MDMDRDVDERRYSRSPPSTVPVHTESDDDYIPPSFPIGPFDKWPRNPIIRSSLTHEWECAFVYNPAAIVFNDRVWLLYRAQNRALISCIGLGWSTDGYTFDTLRSPILIPTEWFERGGGCEDPRIILKDGVFYLTYTAYDGVTPRLALATSRNLLDWHKHGPILHGCMNVQYAGGERLVATVGASKAGAIIADRHPVFGKYYMIWGEGHLQLAESEDLLHWRAKDFNEHFATGVHHWESRLLEPGPPPIRTKDGKYILFYNCSTLGRASYAYNQYSISQMLVDLRDIHFGPLARLEKPCMEVDGEELDYAQKDNVVFCEGVVQYKGKWFMYYGMGDTGIGVATCKAV